MGERMVNECSATERLLGVHNNNAGEPGLFVDHQKIKRVSICMGCGEEILDRYILRVAPDLEWHAACLKCNQCNRYLDETCTAFVREGKTYCKLDYVRLFGVKCAKCRQNFGKNDSVMRAKNSVYHINCFRCVYCDRRLLPGDEYGLREDELFCKNDCEGWNNCRTNSTDLTKHLCDQQSLDPFGMTSGGGLHQLPLSGLNAMTAQQRLATTPPMSTASPKSDEVVTTTTTAASTSASLSKKQKKDKPKTTRVRTVLNEKQLMTLRTCYAANSRPDALMKEQLVEMTGLSARVIRVWFQNKRCKDKKRQIAMKQMQQAQEKDRALNGVRMQGVGPLMAGSPTTHDPMSIGQPLDVQQFPQSASLWNIDPSSCSMHPASISVDQGGPPFQHLMHSFGSGPESGGGGEMGGFLVPQTVDGFGAPSRHDLDSFSPQMNVSDLSSPSCSE